MWFIDETSILDDTWGTCLEQQAVINYTAASCRYDNLVHVGALLLLLLQPLHYAVDVEVVSAFPSSRSTGFGSVLGTTHGS